MFDYAGHVFQGVISQQQYLNQNLGRPRSDYSKKSNFSIWLDFSVSLAIFGSWTSYVLVLMLLWEVTPCNVHIAYNSTLVLYFETTGSLPLLVEHESLEVLVNKIVWHEIYQTMVWLTSIMTIHRLWPLSVLLRVPLVEQEFLTLPEHLVL